MKQFDLDEYLKNPSRRVVTRDGRNVRIICTDRVGIFPIIGLISSDSIADFEEIVWYTKEGVCNTSTETRHDLFFASEKHEGWTPVYREPTGKIRFGYAYSTKKEAEEASKYDTRYITTTNVEWEE